MSRAGWIADAGAVLLLAALGFWAGRAAFAAAPMPAFYQSEFGPAVMIAAGAGFVNPEPVLGGTLQDFLALKLTSIDKGAVDVAQLVAPDQFQNAHRYLLMAVGYWWRVAGISWERLAEISGFSHALAVTSMFALLRLFVPVAPAVLGALWLGWSPLQLGYAPQMRDFAKGAFVLASVPLIVGLVLRGRTRSGLLGLAAAAGAVIGIGIGFKMDVAIMAPIAVTCLVLFRDSRPWHDVAGKAMAITVLLVTLVITSLPITSRLAAGGSNAVHVVLLGYSDWFDARLGIEPAPYSFAPFYSDSYLRNLLQTRAGERSGASAPMPSAAYDAAGFELWGQWLRLFPADVFTRLLAAVDGVLNLAFYNPPGVTGGTWRALSGIFEWLNGWRGWGWTLGAVLVAAAGRIGIIRQLFSVALLMALAGYPSLQFDARHYFHLQAIPIAIIVAVTWLTGSWVARRIRIPSAAAPPETAVAEPWWRWSAAAALVILGLTAVPAVTLRAYQSNQLERVFEAFLAGDRVRLNVEFVPAGGDRWLARWADVQGLPSQAAGLSHAYYLAEFRADGPRTAMAIGLRYSAAPEWSPCAVIRSLATAEGVARFAFPVYSLAGEASFDGIEMGGEMQRRLLGVYRLRGGPAGVPVELRLASDWVRQRLFQRSVREEWLKPDAVGAAVFAPADRCGSQINYVDASLNEALSIETRRIDSVVSEYATVTPKGLVVNGMANVAAPNLVQFKPVTMAAGDALVARVMVDRGALMLGLLKDGAWAGQVAVPRPGLSVVALPVLAAGVYIPILATADPGWRRSVRFTLDRLGVVRADGRVTAAGDFQ